MEVEMAPALGQALAMVSAAVLVQAMEE